MDLAHDLARAGSTIEDLVDRVGEHGIGHDDRLDRLVKHELEAVEPSDRERVEHAHLDATVSPPQRHQTVRAGELNRDLRGERGVDGVDVEVVEELHAELLGLRAAHDRCLDEPQLDERLRETNALLAAIGLRLAELLGAEQAPVDQHLAKLKRVAHGASPSRSAGGRSGSGGAGGASTGGSWSTAAPSCGALVASAPSLGT